MNANQLETHQCVFTGGILQCAHHAINQMLTHESDIMASMIGEAESLEEVPDPSIRWYLQLCMDILHENPTTLTTYKTVLRDMYEKDPSEILMSLFDKKEWTNVLTNFTVQYQFENVRINRDGATDRLPMKEQIIPVYLNTPIPLPGMQQYFLKSINHTDPAGYMRRLDVVKKYLLLSLTVYEHKNGVSIKCFPKHLSIHTLMNMTFNTISEGRVSFRLRGMIIHQGLQVGSGHYYYVLLDDKLRQWAFDDQMSKVVQKNFESFSNGECPYMLLYKRI